VSNTSKPPKTLQRNLKSWKVNFYSIQMGTSTVFFTSIPLKFSQIPRSVRPPIRPNQRFPLDFSDKFQHGFGGIRFFKAKPRRKVCTEAVLSEIPNQKQYPKIGAQSTGSVPYSHLIQVVETAAKTGAEVCFLSFLAQILES
jgi:myo-inositol-1(or 4)-monophosphatase